ncbi:GH25 family lysozyme [Peribacillus butanolivorans]|uniref:GH25 family lysozyme n=1 Tax=Peribacillus butanolivorans TaxID=421767 RepID=UPI0036887742
MFHGIDISEWQGEINFEKVKASGIEVVYIRSSEGNNYVDPYFHKNYEKAKKAGLRIGFYHYVTARSVSQAEYQAHFFVSLISNKEFNGKIAMDFEDLAGLTNSEINMISKAFIKRVEELSGKEAVIYSDASNATYVLDKSLTKYPLWIADYGVGHPSNQVKWSKWSGWQYSDNGRIPGISGTVDLDYFNKEMLLKGSSKIKKPTTKPTSKSTTIIYRVKSGNTLSKIAKLYHTTVDAIVAENHIKNPNLLNKNEKLHITIHDKHQTRNPHAFVYVVRQGDTLHELALRYHTTVKELIKWNDIQDPNRIYAGERLRIRSK